MITSKCLLFNINPLILQEHPHLLFISTFTLSDRFSMLSSKNIAFLGNKLSVLIFLFSILTSFAKIFLPSNLFSTPCLVCSIFFIFSFSLLSIILSIWLSIGFSFNKFSRDLFPFIYISLCKVFRSFNGFFIRFFYGILFHR